MCSLSIEQSVLSRETIQFFFQNYDPFSAKNFYPLSSTQQPSVGTRMRCSCLSSLLVAHLIDAPIRRLVVTGDSTRIQDEAPPGSSVCSAYSTIKRDLGLTSHTEIIISPSRVRYF